MPRPPPVPQMESVPFSEEVAEVAAQAAISKVNSSPLFQSL